MLNINIDFQIYKSYLYKLEWVYPKLFDFIILDNILSLNLSGFVFDNLRILKIMSVKKVKYFLVIFL